jgi:hypothetical protein
MRYKHDTDHLRHMADLDAREMGFADADERDRWYWRGYAELREDARLYTPATLDECEPDELAR